MKLSTRSRYGTRLLLELAKHFGRGPMHLSEVAARQDISVKYLEQLIIPLKRQGLIRSIRGPKGGYVLNRAPETITFAAIVRVLEGPGGVTVCVDNPETCEKAHSCPARSVWLRVSKSMYEQLESMSLADTLAICDDHYTAEDS
jgi:Rrf2 family protein